jgi:hypothetical protein
MTARTRYFVVTSVLVLVVGLGTGLIAYFVGLPGIGPVRGGPDELQYVPRTATVVAFADVREVMSSDLRRRLQDALPRREDGQQEFESQTGINIESDIDRVLAFADSTPSSPDIHGSGLVLARGRFDAVKIEALMREHGAEVEEYKGKRLFVSRAGDSAPRQVAFGLTFLEPGLTALGSAPLLHVAVDLQSGGENITDNAELMEQVRAVQGANNAWVVGRFDALSAQANLPAEVRERLPAITWFSVGTHINGGIAGTFTAQARDEEGAANLRDVVRGLLALAKLQAGARPELQAAVESLVVDGQGTTVTLSFAVPSQVFDLLGQVMPRSQ